MENEAVKSLGFSVEEWNHIPQRLADKPRQLKIVMPDDSVMARPLYGHHSPSPPGDVLQHYGKLLPAFLYRGIATKGQLGDATCYVCDAVGIGDLTTAFLKRNPDLFIDDVPIPVEWYSIS